MGKFTDRERSEIRAVLTYLEKILDITYSVGGLKYRDEGEKQYVDILDEEGHLWRTANVTADNARGVFDDVYKEVQ